MADYLLANNCVGGLRLPGTPQESNCRASTRVSSYTTLLAEVTRVDDFEVGTISEADTKDPNGQT